ncbi:hypothetical protein DE146DRAFT_397354 [Phaeosphaeria sp. MPI-PUGE-AT-0046c]|nr:hypothetical protein DE146DRAFT_397354 [Phaeosphaeria sp. MPI-PUGE-AT-0046c]
MCKYHYVYFTKCQHASFYCISYCDKAKAPNLLLQDSLSRSGSGASTSSDSLPGPSSSRPSASANNNNSSHSHSQYFRQNMSTLAYHDPGTSLAQHVNSFPVDHQQPQHVAQIPRSVLGDDHDVGLMEGIHHVSSVLDTDGHHSLRMAVAMNSQSSASLDSAHEVAHDQLPGITHGSVASVATLRGPSSPRKPIPSQWLPSNSGPNLVTAQRAKERDHKKGFVNGSLVDTKILGSTRSMSDLKRANAVDGASFLTKTAHTAVESDLTVSPTTRSPTKQHRTSSKPAWNSPTGSPRRDSPQQQPHLIIRTSPVRTVFLDAGVSSHGHRRGNSAATSTTGETMYHSAESSPVRGSDDAESYAETLDHISDLQLSVDIEHEQASTGLILPQTASRLAVTGTRIKPSLKIQIPDTCVTLPSGENSSEACSSAISSGLWSSTSASSMSRLPRAAGTHTTSARGPTLSSTLKRAQPSKSLTSLKAKSDVQGKATTTTQPKPTPAESVRHPHFVDPRGATQAWPKHPGMVTLSTHTTVSTDVSPVSAQSGSDSEEDAVTMLVQADLFKPANECSRASSLSTVKATPSRCDPVQADSAIIYSKEFGACGTILDQPLNIPPIMVMMAHTVDVGTFKSDQPQATPDATSSIRDTSPARGRAVQFVPRSHRHAESSENSLHSSLSSDLRATAPEFVPCTSTPAHQDHASIPAPRQAEASSQLLDPSTDLLGSMKWELDMYGIPWFYYMYQVQVAYNEGLQQGRSKSPKKIRQKKNNLRTSGQIPVQIPHTQHASDQQHHSSSMSPPASTVPLAEQRAQKVSDVSVDRIPELPNDAAMSAPTTPFRAQNELIDRQNAFRDMIITERPLPGIDLTTIRNVPEAPRPHGAFNTMQHRGHANQHRRFNNRSDNGLYSYRGRGLTGLRMHDTVPFPAPVPPPGRPFPAGATGQGCSVIEIVYAAEHVGGDACHECEPDHPLD